MKITLLTNLSGKIIGARYYPNELGENGQIKTQIVPTPEQQVHEIDIPAELSQHITEGTLAHEIFNYRVEGIGQAAILIRE
jgi:hypothetical protein